jgi:UDP-glucuronate 4-epimerase
MKILVTGAAGFIGFHTAKRLTVMGHYVTGLDCINDYYDTRLKLDRLKALGFVTEEIKEEKVIQSNENDRLSFVDLNIENKMPVAELFQKSGFDVVIHLAAQAGVRYSLVNPDAYIKSNIAGFLNILEACRHFPVKHLLFASSSSVYGMNIKVPFHPDDNVDHPISLYAATKKSNELMAYTYQHLFNIPVSGLRFFTVYGAWGRPDMAYFSFTKNILEGKEISVFNQGELMRDFTYIDDVTLGITQLMEKAIAEPQKFKYNIYNLGNHQPVKLIDFISTLEKLLGKDARKKFLPMQPGDVLMTYADITSAQNDFGYHPTTNLAEGLLEFVRWYRSYYLG